MGWARKTTALSVAVPLKLAATAVVPAPVIKTSTSSGTVPLMVALVRAGLPRASAYKVAQRNAALAWDGADYKTSVEQDEEVKANLSPDEIQEVFSLEHHLRFA